MKSTNQKCIFCQERIATTDDHIPPKNLFPKPRPSNLITVPACDQCNIGTSSDDEYLRLTIVVRDDTHEHTSAKQAWKTAYRGLSRKTQPRLAYKLIENIKRVDSYSEAGIYLGKRTILNIDYTRVEAILNKIVRGLFYHVVGNPLPNSYMVKVFALEGLTDEVRTDAKLAMPIQIVMEQSPTIIGDNVFSYRHKFFEDDDFAAIWLIEFYSCYRVIAFTLLDTRVGVL
jgi:hypothetical protein